MTCLIHSQVECFAVVPSRAALYPRTLTGVAIPHLAQPDVREHSSSEHASQRWESRETAPYGIEYFLLQEPSHLQALRFGWASMRLSKDLVTFEKGLAPTIAKGAPELLMKCFDA